MTRWGSLRAHLEGGVGSLLLLALLSRVAVVLVAALAGGHFADAAGSGWNRGPGFVRFFARWDSGFYMDIAELGYGFKPEGWAFNPGYPVVLGLLWRVVPGIDLPTAGFLVSNAAFFAAVVLCYRLGQRWFEERVAWRAAAFIAVVPGTMYLSAVYADALFLLLLVASLLAIDKRQWLLAGAWVSVAAITRPTGLLLVGALGLAVLLDTWRARRLAPRAAASLGLAVLLPALFLAYSWQQTGDAFVSANAREVYWPNVQWHPPWNLFLLGGVTAPIKGLVFVGMALVVLTMGYAVYDLAVRRDLRRAPLHAFTLVAGVVYLTYSEPNPITRYLVTLPSMYWMLGEISRPRGVFEGLVAVGSALAAFVTVVFATWGPLY